ncbi:hypothetical protein TSUD_25260 [Trifolium subterraneum]|uniref:holo-[acyl-carrier-protein] synthase n=1 Tax=Trifolium subterraneum TaxID=3900 RepID=A0A2Z6PRK9_TRISU|nr:hypothetical protein TSUD_25260 [Trifolium subterraneum]
MANLRCVDWQYADDWSLPPLHFDISHTSSLIACGVTLGSSIGIDVEEKQRRLKNDILAFARRYFSPHEVEMLTHIVDPELRHQEFIKLWTLKEDEITVDPFGDHRNISSNWHFVLLELLGSHYAAVCIEKDSTSADKGSIPVNLSIRKTIPFVEDECISGADTAVVIGGLSKLLY